VPGYRTNLRISLEDKVAVVVFTNAGDGEPVKYTEKAFKWIAPGLAPKPEEKPVMDLEKYAGKFRNRWGDVEVLVYKGELIMITPQILDPMIEYTVLKHVEGDKFQMKAPGYGSHKEYAVFEFEKGKIKRLKTGENYTYPIDEW
jgi:hypothetical protein